MRSTNLIGERDGFGFALVESFVVNPDLVNRYRYGLPLTDSDPDTYYTPGRRGYTDYPIYLDKVG